MQGILDGMKKANLGGSFGPTADEKVVFSDYSKRLAQGKYIKAPIFVGNTDDEIGLITALAPLILEGAPGTKGVVKRQSSLADLLSIILGGIGCGPHNAALGRRKNNVPAWRYVYGGVFPNSDIGSKGAWHGADIGMAFGTQEFLSHRV